MPASFPLPRVSIGRKVLLGLGLVLVMLVTIPVLTSRTTNRFLKSAEAVNRSAGVLEVCERLLRYMVEMGSSRQAFLGSGKESALEPYQNAQPKILGACSTIQNWTLEDHDQSLRIERVKEWVLRSFALQQLEVDTRRTRGTAPGELMAGLSENQVLERQIYSEVGAIKASEQRLLQTRQETLEAVGAHSIVIVIMGTGLTFAALIYAAVMILRDVRARRRAEEVLADQHNLLSSIVDAMPDHVFVKDVKGRYMMDNRAHRRFLELREGESIEGKTVFDFFPKPLALVYHAGDQEVLESGRALRNQIEPGISRSGVEMWLSTTKVPLWDPAGRMLGLVCVSADVTERKTAEEQLKRFASQLERSNSELQHFASVASHDLQEPLRKIQAFSDRLKAKCGPQLGEVGMDYLARMQGAAERMRVLIQDLLKLTRITSRAQPFEKCDLNVVLREVLSDLELAIEQRSARIQVGPLPLIDADPVQMRQLFQNLISNGIKFQAADKAPVIEIEGTLLEGFPVPGAGEKVCEITVSDNGIGFEPQFTEHIFEVFQRLHSRSEYEGTGIGLAICRKITDRHAGSIVAKSREGHGTTFTVTLPVSQPLNQTHE